MRFLIDSSKYPENNTITFIAQKQGPERVPKTIGNHSKDLACQSMTSHFYSKLKHSLVTSSVTSKDYGHRFQVPMSPVSVVFGAFFESLLGVLRSNSAYGSFLGFPNWPLKFCCPVSVVTFGASKGFKECPLEKVNNSLLP